MQVEGTSNDLYGSTSYAALNMHIIDRVKILISLMWYGLISKVKAENLAFILDDLQTRYWQIV